ncbi:MAG: HAMP domain-containing sensor histidine kinase [Candidatus Bathyarchaeia archaeon]
MSINQNVIYISKIVADLQDYAKIPSIQKEKVDVEKALREALSSVSIPKEVATSISVDKGFPNLNLDPACLRRTLTNLILNAVQAMPDGGKISINAFCQRDNAVISVEDTGNGIPEEVKAKIFAPLFTTKSKGQGFGLVVVKKLTEAMGGEVKFESEKGKGAKFVLTFPTSG